MNPNVNAEPPADNTLNVVARSSRKPNPSATDPEPASRSRPAPGSGFDGPANPAAEQEGRGSRHCQHHAPTLNPRRPRSGNPNPGRDRQPRRQAHRTLGQQQQRGAWQQRSRHSGKSPSPGAAAAPRLRHALFSPQHSPAAGCSTSSEASTTASQPLSADPSAPYWSCQRHHLYGSDCGYPSGESSHDS